MDKPEYLYHGDRNRQEVLEPRQAVGAGGEPDCRNAVYAVAARELAIPFAITFVPTAKEAVFSVDTETKPPRFRLRNTDVRWDKIGYLYTLPSNSFEKADERQWVSYSPVRPVRIEEIDPKDYRGWFDNEQE
ncbi:MAG: hypothetical protein SCH71_14120 [Desulfobulbaceae bacterium]|nr:hypothetical protein [Desulfobulbaceae bacterium]